MHTASDGWSAELRLADFDRLVASVRRWVETAPAWPSFDRTRALWNRIAPRLDQLKIEADRVLVVGIVGGTGTGKSTLLNALVGQRICQAGDVVRPTTRQPVVLAGPATDLAFLHLDDNQCQVHRVSNSPLLEQMVLIDCPDPDTQDRDDSSPPIASAEQSADRNGNLDLLRRILPHCDVLLCTGTAQKYKTQAVAEELLRHAPGRQVVFVQTHAALDADITADWQCSLESQGFTVPRIFRLDSEAALMQLEQRRPVPAEFSSLVEFLQAELADCGRHRILRTNALDLLTWFLTETQREIDAAIPAITKLDETITAERTRLFELLKARVHDQLCQHQGVWRARLLREVTLRWGGGPFAGFLRLMNSARSWAPLLPALRARGLGPMLVAGGVGAGQAVARHVRESLQDDQWAAAAELGLNAGDVAQSQSVLTGYARDAGIEIEHRDPTRTSAVVSLAATASQFHQQIEADIHAAIQSRAARRANVIFHGLLELLFLALPAVLLWRLGKNFFFEHLWLESTQPLLGFDFLLQSALWVIVWGLLLRGLLAWQLQRGLRRDLVAVVESLTPDAALHPLFDSFTATSTSIRRHVGSLTALRNQVDRLRGSLESAAPWQLGRLQPTITGPG